MDYTTCVSQCPPGKYEDSFGHCDLCHYTCKECFGPADFQCSTCFHHDDDDHNDDDEEDGYEYKGKCYKYNCPANTYYEDHERKCFECS